MARNPDQVLIYHITDVVNLPDILQEQRLLSDALLVERHPKVIGYDHIKKRRLQEIQVPCCNNRFVGSFVPFYFCPRSPMLFTINKGNTGHSPGTQESILHLVSTVVTGIMTGHPWAISSGNAGAFHTTFSASLATLEDLDWEAIKARQWQGKQHQKSAEFLVADFFPWVGINKIGCQNVKIRDRIISLLKNEGHKPEVEARPDWYY